MIKSYVLLSFLPLLASSQTPPTVCLEQGTCYKGSWLESSVGGLCPPCRLFNYATFQGIRYAKPPIGDLRFKAPQPHYEVAGEYDVSNMSYVQCPQVGILDGQLVGQEDCLTLNIYIHESNFNDAQANLPVMVWIHGGGLSWGSNNFNLFGPQHLIKKDVIVVAINYRLGPLGFLSLGNADVPGNAGLRDQSLALAWVRDHIASFRGDPNSVTIFGESAGALSTAMHILSPISTGLFQRAILQSGSALNPGWGPITQVHALKYANMISEAVGCHTDESQLQCLQSSNYEDLITKKDSKDGAYIWYPVPENGFGSTKPFFLMDADELMASGQFNKDIEVIIGTNTNEGTLNFFEVLADPTKWEDFKNEFDIFGPQFLFNIANKSEITETDLRRTHKILEFYVGSVDNIDEEHKQGLFDMFTDAQMVYGAHKTIKYLTQYGVKVYNYILSYEGPKSFTQLFGIDPEGVSHIDDLIYLFDPIYQYGEQPVLGPIFGYSIGIREFMTSAWTSFATSGDPNHPDFGLSWEPQPFDEGKHYFWNITYPPVMANNQDLENRMAFWEDLMSTMP